MTAIQDPSEPLQRALFAVWTGYAPLTALIAKRVYDKVPADNQGKNAAQFPYVAFGEFQVLSEKVECLAGAEVYVTMHAWSREPGAIECRRIVKALIAAVDDNSDALSGEDLQVKSCLLDSATIMPDPDGLTTHGVVTFHILTD